MTNLKFVGTKVLNGTLENIPTDEYTIEILIKDKDLGMDFEYTDSTPPMPLNIGGWALMKKDLKSYFLFNTENKVGTNIKIKTGKELSIKIVSKNNPERTFFYIDDKFHSVKRVYTPLKSFYRLGYGLINRKWTGEISSAKIIDESNSFEEELVNHYI